MSQRIKDLSIDQIANGELTSNEFTKKGTQPASEEELHHALNRLGNAYKPLHNELEQSKHDIKQLKKQRWKHYKIIGMERLLIGLTFVVAITTLILTACNA